MSIFFLTFNGEADTCVVCVLVRTFKNEKDNRLRVNLVDRTRRVYTVQSYEGICPYLDSESSAPD